MMLAEREMSTGKCAGCEAPLRGQARKWCSERCRRRTCYSGVCVDCGAETYSGNARPPERCIFCFNRHRAIWDRESLIDVIQAWAELAGGIPPGATDWNPNQALTNGHPEKAERFYADGCWPHVSTVRDVFGSWNAAIEAAGLTARPAGIYGRDGEDMDLCREIRERYEAGESTLTLAKEYGCGNGTIAYRIRKAGGTLRSGLEAQRLRWSA